MNSYDDYSTLIDDFELPVLQHWRMIEAVNEKHRGKVRKVIIDNATYIKNKLLNIHYKVAVNYSVAKLIIYHERYSIEQHRRIRYEYLDVNGLIDIIWKEFL